MVSIILRRATETKRWKLSIKNRKEKSDMTKFEPSAHAKSLSELDKHSGQTLEYWSKEKWKI